MYPIYKNKMVEGIGQSFDTFVKNFIDICENHLNNGQAKAFCFILYNFEDSQLKDEIFSKQGSFAMLDRLSGKNLTVFYLNSHNKRIYNAFNDIFLGAFKIKDQYRLPLVLFFKIVDREVTDVEVVELEQTDLLFAFKELYDIIENYIERLNNSSLKLIKSNANKISLLVNKVKKIALNRFIEWLLEMSARSIYRDIIE